METMGLIYFVAMISQLPGCFNSCDNCEEPEPISGCTDPASDNYNSEAEIDDGSCTYCDDFEVLIIGVSDAIDNTLGSVQATGVNGSGNYSVNVYNLNGVIQNPFALTPGNYWVVIVDETFSCSGTEMITISEPAAEVLGCTDPAAENYNSSATVDDGSCITVSHCDIVPSGLFVDNIIHNRIVFNWSVPDAAPSHYMIRYRPVGTSGWTSNDSRSC